MWCLSCFKSSTSEDRFEAETGLALEVSREDADTEEAKQLALALEESSRLHQRQKEAEKLRRRELEKGAQIAHAFHYDEGEMDNNSALEEDKRRPAKTAVESSKDKGKIKIKSEEQVKNDEELARIVQESLNMEEPPPPPPPLAEERKSIPRRAAALNVEQQRGKDKGKGKLTEGGQVKSDEEFAAIVQESLNMVEPPTELEEKSNISSSRPLMDEDEQRTIWESLKGKGQITTQSEDDVEENGSLPKMNPPPPSPRMCAGCNTEIEHERSVVECLWCDACHEPIAVHEVDNHVSNSRGKFHDACYERYCYVCQEKKMRKYNHHPFWEERYCPAHDSDGTPKCCSCERLEPKGANYVKLGDSRWLCLECMESAVMDTDEAHDLHIDIREFFEGLNMKIEKAFPLLLVEKQALNKAKEEEKIDYQYEVVTRGICLSEAQTVTSVSKRPRVGPQNQLIDMVTESHSVVRNCEVTAILILYGLPRLMTGYILAHEMMHAYLRLKGYKNLNNVMEEGICQVLGHMWLESQTYATIDASEAAVAVAVAVASSSAAAVASSTRTRAATALKKGACSDFEKKLVDFCKNQIETDESRVYGVGFRKVNHMVSNSSLKETLKEIVRRQG